MARPELVLQAGVAPLHLGQLQPESGQRLGFRALQAGARIRPTGTTELGEPVHAGLRFRHLGAGAAELRVQFPELLIAHEASAGVHQLVGGLEALHRVLGGADPVLHRLEVAVDRRAGISREFGLRLGAARDVGVDHRVGDGRTLGGVLARHGDFHDKAALDPTHRQAVTQCADGARPRVRFRRFAGRYEKALDPSDRLSDRGGAGVVEFRVLGEPELIHHALQEVGCLQHPHLALGEVRDRVGGLGGGLHLGVEHLQAARIDDDLRGGDVARHARRHDGEGGGEPEQHGEEEPADAPPQDAQQALQADRLRNPDPGCRFDRAHRIGLQGARKTRVTSAMPTFFKCCIDLPFSCRPVRNFACFSDVSSRY